jgi:hypothetical protein
MRVRIPDQDVVLRDIHAFAVCTNGGNKVPVGQHGSFLVVGLI